MTYKTGKDLKQKGDCLTHLFIKKIEHIMDNTPSGKWIVHNIPEDFEKW